MLKSRLKIRRENVEIKDILHKAPSKRFIEVRK